MADSTKFSPGMDKTSTSKAYSITNAIWEKEQEKAEVYKAEGSTEEKASTVIEEMPSERHEYIIRHASRGKTVC